MRSTLKSNIPLDDCSKIDKAIWICPFCNHTSNPIISWGPGYIQCDGCFDRNFPSFIGIKILSPVAYKNTNLGDLDGFYLYSIEILEFTGTRNVFFKDECYNKTFITTDGTEFTFKFN